MEDSLSKYLKLGGSIMLAFLSFILLLAIFMVSMRLLFGVLDQMSWMNFIFLLFILSVPAAIFITAFIVFYKRTAMHTSGPVRIISRVFFLLALIGWVIIYILDMITFAKHSYAEIFRYYSFNLLYLFISVALIFFTGVLQALTTEKEKDWHDRVR